MEQGGCVVGYCVDAVLAPLWGGVGGCHCCCLYGACSTVLITEMLCRVLRGLGGREEVGIKWYRLRSF